MTRPMDAVQNAPTRFTPRPQASALLTEGSTQGDISTSLRMGTFLFRVDMSAGVC
jgi:hypothetical protein